VSFDAATVFWVLFVVALVLIVTWGVKRAQPRTKRYIRTGMHEEMEIDLRLPYKRFKDLYPWSKITYEEYKRLQMQRAFRRAVSSQENKRMVR
jgi:hypothetical protein